MKIFFNKFKRIITVNFITFPSLTFVNGRGDIEITSPGVKPFEYFLLYISILKLLSLFFASDILKPLTSIKYISFLSLAIN